MGSSSPIFGGENKKIFELPPPSPGLETWRFDVDRWGPNLASPPEAKPKIQVTSSQKECLPAPQREPCKLSIHER